MFTLHSKKQRLDNLFAIICHFLHELLICWQKEKKLKINICKHRFPSNMDNLLELNVLSNHFLPPSIYFTKMSSIYMKVENMCICVVWEVHIGQYLLKNVCFIWFLFLPHTTSLLLSIIASITLLVVYAFVIKYHFQNAMMGLTYNRQYYFKREKSEGRKGLKPCRENFIRF